MKGWMMMKTIMTFRNDDACLARQHCEGVIRQHYLLDGVAIESSIEAHRSGSVDARSMRVQTHTGYVCRAFLVSCFDPPARSAPLIHETLAVAVTARSLLRLCCSFDVFVVVDVVVVVVVVVVDVEDEEGSCLGVPLFPSTQLPHTLDFVKQDGLKKLDHEPSN